MLMPNRVQETHSIRHEGEPGVHISATYADRWHATPSGADLAPADLTEGIIIDEHPVP